MTQSVEERPKEIDSEVVRIGAIGEKDTQMSKCRRDVCVWFGACVSYMLIGSVDMKVNTIPILTEQRMDIFSWGLR